MLLSTTHEGHINKHGTSEAVSGFEEKHANMKAQSIIHCISRAQSTRIITLII